MTHKPLSTSERDELVRRISGHHRRRFPGPGAQRPNDDQYYQEREHFYLSVGEYFDRLPRVILSGCPYCGAALVRAFDPWGVDGLWWGVDAICKFDEPAPCEHFRVLLGAVRVDEATLYPDMIMESLPGPEVPFVVPHLLELAGMVAVLSALPLVRSGPAYPIAYFSDHAIEPVELHPNWCRTVLWFEQDGQPAWTAANDQWDFELEPYVQSEKLRWVMLDANEDPPRVRRSGDGESCPFVGLPGERLPQRISGGKRTFGELPDGTPPDPFGD